MSYSPKYFTNLTRAISIIRSNLRNDVRSSPSNDDIENRLEEAETIVDNFLESSGFDLSLLDTVTEANARIMATQQTVLLLVPMLPLEEDDKRNLKREWREALKETEERFLRRKYPSSEIKAVVKRIPPGYGREWGTEEDRRVRILSINVEISLEAAEEIFTESGDIILDKYPVLSTLVDEIAKCLRLGEEE